MYKYELYPDVDDDKKLYHKYLNKCNNAKKENLLCELTYDEFANLLRISGYKSSDLGWSGNKIVLARFEDTGNYTIDNCRFIPHSENMKERKVSELARISSRNNAMHMNNIMQDRRLDPNYCEYISNKIKHSDYALHRKQLAIEHAQERKLTLDLRYAGEHNSQYGTYWITNGVSNKKWKDSYGNMPDGYYKGRVC